MNKSEVCLALLFAGKALHVMMSSTFDEEQLFVVIAVLLGRAIAVTSHGSGSRISKLTVTV